MSLIAVYRHQNVKWSFHLLIKMAKMSAKKIKSVAKSKPLASKRSFIHILIKEDMGQIDLKGRRRGIPIRAPPTPLKMGLLHCKTPISRITLSLSVCRQY